MAVPMSVAYVSGMISGFLFHEIACSFQFMLSLIGDNRKIIRHPLFLLGFGTWFSSVVGHISYSAIMEYTFDTPAERLYTPEATQFHAPRAITGAMAGVIRDGSMATILFLRSLILYRSQKTDWFLIYSYFAIVTILLSSITVFPFAYLCFREGYAYSFSPYYNWFLLFGGIGNAFAMAIHTTVSNFMFLYKVYSAKGFTTRAFLHDWITNQGGGRYLLLLVVNGYMIYSITATIFVGNTEVTIHMFAVSPLNALLSLYVTLMNTFRTAGEVLNRKPNFEQQSEMPTMPSIAVSKQVETQHSIK
jgi:hypothetical protein